MSQIAIQTIDLGQGGFSGLGITACDYLLPDTHTALDYEALTLHLTKARAHTVEAELQPLAQKMQDRNEALEAMGNALAAFTAALEAFESDAEGTDTTSFPMDSATYSLLVDYNILATGGFVYVVSSGTMTATKAGLSGASEAIKTAMDGLNNAAQLDMTRLESLVARRDEAFEAAATLRKSISSSRDTLLKGIR